MVRLSKTWHFVLEAISKPHKASVLKPVVNKAFKLLSQHTRFFSPEILIWIVTVIVLVPVLKPGFFSFHDETHIVDVYQMIRSLELGGFPPRFAPDFNFGLGHPYFNFYYHLPFYITALFHYLGFSMTDGFKYMLGIAVIFAASGFYFLLRNHVSKVSASFGTLIYILSPYFAVDLYVRGSPGEMYIFALFPWAGFLLVRYLKDPMPVNLALASSVIFLISISHNVLLPFIYSLLFLYGYMNLVILETGFKASLKIFLPFVIGILFAAYYLLPAFTEVKFISTYEQINISDHFPFIKQLIIPHWGYGPSIWGPLDDISFDIGTVNIILLLVSFFIFKWAKRETKILLIFFWLVFGIAVVLTNNRTLFFWESIRFLRLVQFPWRMLLLTTIATSFIGALTIEAVSQNFKKIVPIFLITIFALLLALNIWHYHPSENKQISDERYLELYFANRTLLGNGERGAFSLEYLNFAEDFIPPTIWQAKKPTNILEPVKLATGSGTINYFRQGLGYKIIYYTLSESEIIISKAYFPGWKATLGNSELKVRPLPPYGIISIPVPKGNGQINLEFGNTTVRIIANTISAVTAGLILVLLIYPVFKKRK